MCGGAAARERGEETALTTCLLFRSGTWCNRTISGGHNVRLSVRKRTRERAGEGAVEGR